MSLSGSGPAGKVPSTAVVNATLSNIYDEDIEMKKMPLDDGLRRRKGSVNIEQGEVYQMNTNGSEGQIVVLSTSEPWDEDEAGLAETQQFTFRAVFVGCCLGAVIGASK